MSSDTVKETDGGVEARWKCTIARPCLWRSLLEARRVEVTDPPGWRDESPPASSLVRKHAIDRVYQPIHDWQTRLIRLHPAEAFGDDLRCDLVTASFTLGRGFGTQEFGRVDFEALSYSWGYPSFTCSIVCNGVPLPITVALSTALRFLRRDTHRMLWTDALCINQLDLAEKSRQVESMLLIFERAERVLAWLGNATLGDRLFLEALRLLGNASESDRKQRSQCPVHLPTLRKLHVQFVQKPFFSRTWIRQEICQARNLVACCGLLTCNYGFMMDTTADLRKCYGSGIQHSSETGEFDSSDSLWNLKTRLKMKGEGHRPWRYLEPFIDGALFNASDDRDRIYGVIGVLEGCKAQHGGNDPDQPMLDIDYSEHVDRLYLRFITHYVQRFKSFQILRLVSRRAKTRRNNTLPSWAIDFRREVAFIRDVSNSDDQFRPRSRLRPFQPKDNDAAGERTDKQRSKLEKVGSNDDGHDDTPNEAHNSDLDDFMTLVVKGERVGTVRQLLTDSEAREYCRRSSLSATEVPQLVLEKTLSLAEVDFQLKVDTLYENRQSRLKRLMSPIVPLGGHRIEVRRATVALAPSARSGDLLVQINAGGTFAVRELTGNGPDYAFVGPVRLETGSELVVNGRIMSTQEFVFR